MSKKDSRKSSSNDNNIKQVIKIIILLALVYIIYKFLAELFERYNMINIFKSPFNKDKCMLKYNNKCICFNERLMDLYMEYINNPIALENKIRTNPNIIKKSIELDAKSKLIDLSDDKELKRNIRNILRECHPDKNRKVTDENIKQFTSFITKMINSSLN